MWPAVSDFSQPADFLEHPHYSDLSGHTSVLGFLTAVHVPLFSLAGGRWKAVSSPQIPLGTSQTLCLTRRAR
jgi:hypothetical protein